MNADDYVREAKRTDVTDYAAQMNRIIDVIPSMHGLMGITTESGELMDAYKKFIMYGKPLDIANIREELGDIMWYIALICHSNNISLNEIMDLNIAKLRARYPDRFSEHAALNRDLTTERKILEG
jgi:NTP pyrophosphatase (non-canonical NTP hydrolase)